MKATWDPAKAAANLAKHGIRFSDSEAVLFDAQALTVEDVTAEGERRYVTLGLDALGRVLVVVYTHRGDEVRLISARRATRRERKTYEKGI